MVVRECVADTLQLCVDVCTVKALQHETAVIHLHPLLTHLLYGPTASREAFNTDHLFSTYSSINSAKPLLNLAKLTVLNRILIKIESLKQEYSTILFRQPHCQKAKRLGPYRQNGIHFSFF